MTEIQRDYKKILEKHQEMPLEIEPAASKLNNARITMLSARELAPFPNHPFKLYTGEKFDDLVESIRTNGILSPLLVRNLENGTYQILSGHNRFAAAKAAQCKEFPCIILKHLTDDDALMILLDSNTKQRGITEIKISEQAHIFALDVEVNKRQGKRSDLIKNIEKNLEILSSGTDLTTLCPMGTRTDTLADVSEKYGVSKRTIARLIRIDTLIPALKVRVDDETIAVRAGVELSYLSAINQKFVDDIMTEYGYKIDIKKAQQLRELQQKDKFGRVTVVEVFEGRYGKPSSVAKTLKAVTLKPKFLAQYYDAASASSADIAKDIETGISVWQQIKKSFPEQSAASIGEHIIELLRTT